MYALKEMHKLEGSDAIIYLSRHTEIGLWKWDVVDHCRLEGYAPTRSRAYSQAIIAAGWIDVQYWRGLAG